MKNNELTKAVVDSLLDYIRTCKIHSLSLKCFRLTSFDENSLKLLEESILNNGFSAASKE